MFTFQPSFKPLLLKGGGVDCEIKEENSKTFVPITSKNSACVWTRI